MPTIKIPEDFQLDVEDGEIAQGVPPSFTFVSWFITRTILRDHKFWGATTERLFACMEIRTAFKGKKSGELVEITEDQWRKLCECVNTPSEPYNVIVMVSGKTFFDAVLKPHEK